MYIGGLHKGRFGFVCVWHAAYCTGMVVMQLHHAGHVAAQDLSWSALYNFSRVLYGSILLLSEEYLLVYIV